MVELFFDLPLITVLFTDAFLGSPWKTVLLNVITFMVGTFDRYCAASGYELSKARDEAVTTQDDVSHKKQSATA